MSGRNARRPPKKRGAANGYKLADPIPPGEIFTDMTKKQWIVGSSIGTGGFGEIYSAASYTGNPPKEYPMVIKIEPHGNGPLFVEMHFYVRNAKSDDIEAWKRKRKLSSLGMPRYVGSGSHECNGTKYRFVVTDRHGTDLWKLFLENGRRFPERTVYKVALQIIDILEYIHHRTYVHADIKGANLLLDLSCRQVYLVDFGLASRCTTKPEYKLDPKKAHNGTIEYTSRDAHVGVPTMRGDFEILGYNMIQWLCGSLPWETDLKDPTTVQKRKERAFENVPRFLNECFSGPVPDPIARYVTLLADVKFDENPNYENFKEILLRGLEKLGHKPGGTLEFNAASATSSKSDSAPTRVINDKAVRGQRGGPRTRQRTSSLNESHEELVISEKHGGATVIKKILEDIDANDDDSDVEYDIRITKKTKRKPRKTVSDEKEGATKNRKGPEKRVVGKARPRKKSDRETESEPEVRSMGTKSRPRIAPKTESCPTDEKAPSIVERKAWLKRKSDTDEDMFDDDDDDDESTATTPSKTAKMRDFAADKVDRVSKSPRIKKRDKRDENCSRKRR